MANDIFGDFFGDSMATTKAIVDMPRTGFGAVQALGLFEESGIDSLSALLDNQGGRITLLPAIPRSGVGEPLSLTRRRALRVDAAYYRQDAVVTADEVQGVRAIGGADRDTVQGLVQRKLAAAKQNIEASVAQQQMSALNGLVTDGNGTNLVDLLALFGVSQSTQSLALATSTTDVVSAIVAALRKGEDGLAGPMPSRWVAFADPAFMDALRGNANVREVLAAWQGSAAVLNADYRPAGAVTLGGVDFIEVRSPAGSTIPAPVAAGTALLTPIGIPGMFSTFYAPAPRVEAVNDIGLPFYGSSEPLAHGRGYSLVIESCPISVCTRPGGIVKLTAA